jgi:hypothetical protein
MGVSIYVEGLVNIRMGLKTSISRAGWNFVADICKIMGWEEIPWQEPTEVRGLVTSRSYGTYNLLLKIALAADPNSPPYRLDGGIICDCKSTVFPQLLDRDIYRNIYVPFDLAGKIVHGESEGNTSFSLGSVVRYSQELDKLAPYIQADFITQAFQADEIETARILDRVEDLVKILRVGIEDSLRLNLPFFVSW